MYAQKGNLDGAIVQYRYALRLDPNPNFAMTVHSNIVAMLARKGALDAAILEYRQMLGLDKEADVNAKDEYGRTVLMLASEEGHREIVQLLLTKGADVSAKTSTGGTALDAATAGGHADIRALLQQAGAKP
ncbi:MAG: ankyrin repeat domain-containing protein [Deltaproteobacteria bacterium]|nr:ankyrin repeat domain-containing protein [Deltaproteobacteria bacterium]